MSGILHWLDRWAEEFVVSVMLAALVLLLGMEVFDADTGARYGVLCDVSETGANDVYHIRFDDGVERLIPAIPQVVASVDLPGNRMEIRPLEGLFDL